jgi:hypothetical protein
MNVYTGRYQTNGIIGKLNEGVRAISSCALFASNGLLR